MKFTRESDYSSVSHEGYRISLYRVGLESVYVAWKSRERIHTERVTAVNENQAREAFNKCKAACVQHRSEGKR